jgi:hypothetical protein
MMQHMRTDAAGKTIKYDLELYAGNSIRTRGAIFLDFVNIARGFFQCARTGRRLAA